VKKKKSERTFDEAVEYYRGKIERGELVKNGGYIYEMLQSIWVLGEGNWQKGQALYLQRERDWLDKQRKKMVWPAEQMERIIASANSMATLAQETGARMVKAMDKFFAENPEFAVYAELDKSGKNPLDLLEPDNPVHRALMMFLLRGGHNLPATEALELIKKLRQEELSKTAMRFRREEIPFQEDLNLATLNRFADMWEKRGWTRMKGYNIDQWLSDNNAPGWINPKKLQRYIKERKEGRVE
jgi:hypothetical protein